MTSILLFPLALLILPMIVGSEAPDDARKKLVVAVKRTKPAIVVIRSVKQKPRGLGVIVDPKGIIVTPYDVINGIDKTDVVLRDRRKLTAKVIASFPKKGVAVLKIDSTATMPHVEFANSDKAKVGDYVFELYLAFQLDWSICRGIISGKKDKAILFMDSVRSFPVENNLLFDLNGKLLGIGNDRDTGQYFLASNRVREVVMRLTKKKSTGD